MGEPMDLDSDAVSLPSAERAPQQVPPEGNRKQPAVPIHSSRAVEPKKAGKRLYTKKGTNAKLLRLLSNIPRLVRYDAITFLNVNLEIILNDSITFLAQTTLPSTIASSDPYVITVFQVLDAAIDGSESIRSRLA
ncbi:hypothetical protein B0T17DRAFT_612173 [Bombardia bombarda]|uniref:Uncharacterized protein n=1 Tax=Bombardia bombarda TaxID=252184 RepID=A0AA40CFB6_9PEZI|nr:hypothetical protein B0T17DRAFT_612173 [Bombardia bombarda]